MGTMNNFFKNKLLTAAKEEFLKDDDEKQLEESTIVEVEKAIEKLKQEETDARNEMIEELKDVFMDLPVVL